MSEIKVILRVYGALREKLGWSSREVMLKGSATLGNLLEKIPDLSEYIVRDGELSEYFIVLINGKHAQFLGGLRARLKNGDEVDIFPPGAGG